MTIEILTPPRIDTRPDEAARIVIRAEHPPVKYRGRHRAPWFRNRLYPTITWSKAVR